MARPIITLTSDFGTRDFYVAAMKGAVLRRGVDAQLIDVTHEVPPQDIRFGAILLERAVASFAAGTVHLAVVDPGVGTARRLLIAAVRDQWIVCPDNGLITWAWRRQEGGRAYELIWRPAETPSTTFHGRDILAPATALLAGGEPLDHLARPIDDPVLLDMAPATGRRGQVIHIDHYGNATTNIPAEHIGTGDIRIKERSIGPLRSTYADVAPGQPLALIGSSGLLEIAVRNGSAAALGIQIGDTVETF